MKTFLETAFAVFSAGSIDVTNSSKSHTTVAKNNDAAKTLQGWDRKGDQGPSFACRVSLFCKAAGAFADLGLSNAWTMSF